MAARIAGAICQTRPNRREVLHFVTPDDEAPSLQVFPPHAPKQAQWCVRKTVTTRSAGTENNWSQFVDTPAIVAATKAASIHAYRALGTRAACPRLSRRADIGKVLIECADPLLAFFFSQAPRDAVGLIFELARLLEPRTPY